MIDSIKHSAVLSRCHSHCLLIHGQRNCLIKVSSTVSPWRESDFVRLSSCLNGNVDHRSCPPERPVTPAQVFYLFWLMSPGSWWTLFEVTQLYELIRMIKEGSAPPNSNRGCIANRKGMEMPIKNNVHTFMRVEMHRTPCSHSFLYDKWQLPLGIAQWDSRRRETGRSCGTCQRFYTIPVIDRLALWIFAMCQKDAWRKRLKSSQRGWKQKQCLKKKMR